MAGGAIGRAVFHLGFCLSLYLLFSSFFEVLEAYKDDQNANEGGNGFPKRYLDLIV